MRVNAPWSQDIVDRLNAHQSAGYVHEYTCGNCGHALTATTDGWVCESPKPCNYTQSWAHEPPTLEQLEAMNPAKFFERQSIP